jgi:hypothetical protein
MLLALKSSDLSGFDRGLDSSRALRVAAYDPIAREKNVAADEVHRLLRHDHHRCRLAIGVADRKV